MPKVGDAEVKVRDSVPANSVTGPSRDKTKEGAKLTVVFNGAPDLVMTFDSEELRDVAANMVQSSCKRGAMIKGTKVKSREGVFFFCSVAYVRVDY